MLLKSSSRSLLKILNSETECYAYVNSMHNISVIFTFPTVEVAKRLYRLCSIGVVPSEEIDEYIWSNQVLYYFCPEQNQDLIDATKLNLSNVIFYYSTFDDLDSVENNMNFANHFYSSHSDVLPAFMKLLNKDTDVSVKNTDVFQFFSNILIEVQRQQKTPAEFFQQYSKLFTGDPEVPQQVDKSKDGRTVEEIVRDIEKTNIKEDIPAERGKSDKTPRQVIEGGRTFSNYSGNPDAARQDPIFAGVFEILDKISAGELTPEQVERLNPTRVIGGNAEVLNGKIIDEDSFVPARKKRAKRRVR